MTRGKRWTGRLSDAAARRGPWVFRAYVLAVAVIATPIMVALGLGKCAAAAYEELCDSVMPDVRFLASAFFHCIKTGTQA